MKHRFVIFIFFFSIGVFAQTNNRVAIVDTEFIMKKMPEFQEAEKELQKRANEWDLTITRKKKEIKDLKDALATERPLLTQQLIDERQEDIEVLERELLTFQHEKFGPDGDYFIQKRNLVKPLQDQIFTIVNEIAEKKKYGVVLDKADSDNSMIYANNRFDISDQVLRQLEKARNSSKMTKQEIAALEAQEREFDKQERQRTKREEFEERNREIQRQKEDQIINDYLANNPQSALQSPEERLKQQQLERQNELKRRQEELRQQQLKKVEEQKRKIEEQRLAVQRAQEKAREEAEKKKQQILEQQKLALEKQKQAQKKQQERLEELKRQQLLRKIEAEKKQAERLAERKKMIEERKKQMEELRQQRLKEQEEAKAKRLKEQEEARNRSK